MPEFLTTTGISDRLQKIIREADEFLVLISPYWQTNPRIRELLEQKSRTDTHIRVIYRKLDLHTEEGQWIYSLPSIELCFREPLHAKCYLNEKEALLTSMNLYQFSEVNNDEMGILVSRRREDDSGRLYNQIYSEAAQIARLSEKIREVPRKERASGFKGLIRRFTNQGQADDGEDTASLETTEVNSDSDATTSLVRTQTNTYQPDAGQVTVSGASESAQSMPATGFCIRCSSVVPANPTEPYCNRCYRTWNRFKNEDYEEKVCHLCGNAEATTMAKPLCLNCYRTFEDAFV